MKTLLVNGTSTIELNVKLSKTEQFKEAVAQGFNAGKTSFINLINGKVEVVKGWVLRIIEEVKTTFNMLQALVRTGLEFSKIKEAKTETYGTIIVGQGRLQLNPLQNGTFSVMFFPKKQADEAVVSSAVKTFGGDVKSQYTKFGKMNLQTIDALIASL